MVAPSIGLSSFRCSLHEAEHKICVDLDFECMQVFAKSENIVGVMILLWTTNNRLIIYIQNNYLYLL